MAGHVRTHPSGMGAGRLIASMQEGLVAIGTQDGRIDARLALPGAGALCCTPGMLYCAADDGMIWKIYPQELTPAALFPGGPGIAQLCTDERSKTLYALSGEADSVLMCCARSGRPLFLNRAGVNPQGMMYDRATGMLAVAGGRQEAVLLLCGRTLRRMAVLAMPGMVCTAAVKGRRVYALCQSDACACMLMSRGQGGAYTHRLCSGLPGLLALRGNRLLAAAQDTMYTVSSDGAALFSCRRMPGHADRLITWKGGRPGEAMLDQTAQTLYLKLDADWYPALEGVRDIALCTASGK